MYIFEAETDSRCYQVTKRPPGARLELEKKLTLSLKPVTAQNVDPYACAICLNKDERMERISEDGKQ